MDKTIKIFDNHSAAFKKEQILMRSFHRHAEHEIKRINDASKLLKKSPKYITKKDLEAYSGEY